MAYSTRTTLWDLYRAGQEEIPTPHPLKRRAALTLCRRLLRGSKSALPGSGMTVLLNSAGCGHVTLLLILFDLIDLI